MSNHRNIVRIKAVHGALKDLRKEVVFVGGATVSLYADRMAEEVRPTDDVDVLIELWTHRGYAELEEKLRSIGFTNDQESGIICRFTIQGITVDVMPIEKSVLGFSNKWYPEGYKNAIDYEIDDHVVKIFSAPYFIASKLEAFKSRGKNDGRTSTDFEDIVFVFENRFSIWEELKQCNEAVKEYLKSEFRNFLNSPLFEEWIDAHAGYGSPPATYYITEQLKEFVNT
ncbi:nucleotidyl transferase AbiEii/AbiGii toxin family protein [Panacibacter sp. DH6]|uniref:Nucleotidyl transferase AbiEii/AbiGii toxin family protein n=1 Tax=Panacibacter microcysteis TaxID=2793269 RepID=A0A931GTW7_9BACT|nr:nucleotidyl transferase AbiEii/AbiGii toxin family protein [Panacibacter microcysteis]MBG9374770.1 nucleotidyl transferase AbiEii/AbiGii toxin family protein [Panacibacter microcysteis]